MNIPLTAPITEFCAWSGLGRTKVYELLDSGEITSIKIGKRRLIVLDSYRQLVDQKRAEAARA
jgi:excisionase family DNA binding protein